MKRMPPPAVYPPALRKRRNTNLRRYVHTGGFNRLAERSTAPGRMRRPVSFGIKVLLVLLTAIIWGIGLAGLIF